MTIDFIRRFGFRLLLPALVLASLSACDSPEQRADDHFRRGTELVREGSPEKALLEFRNAIELNAGHPAAHFAIGRILEAQGKLDGAASHYLAAVNSAPENVEARLSLASILLLANDLAKAEQHISAALELQPNHVRGQTLRAALALKQGDLAAARRAIEKAAALEPGNVELAIVDVNYLRDAEGPQAALARADDALDAHPDALPLHLLKLQILQDEDDQPAVGAQLVQMVGKFPAELRIRDALAKWGIRNGRTEIALTELRALVAALPGDTRAVVNLVNYIRAQSGEDAARAELVRLIGTSSDPVPLELLLAHLDAGAGRRADAIANLRAVIGRAGGRANEARLALAHMLAGEGRNDDADRLVDAVLASDPRSGDALAMKVARLIDQGDLETATHLLGAALNDAPDDVRLLLLSARIQARSGRSDLASNLYARAVRQSGFEPGAVRQYVRFLDGLERHSAAVIVLSEASRRNPTDPTLLDLLASERIRLENWDGAAAAIARLARIDPARATQLRAAALIGQERFDEGAHLAGADLPADARLRAISIALVVQAHQLAGRPDAAAAFLDRTLAADPRNVEALGLSGNLLLAAGEFDKAEARYREVLAIDPDNGSAWSALSRVAEARGDREGEEAVVRQGLIASPDSILLLARLAHIYEHRGDQLPAIGIYEQLRADLPNSRLVANNLASLLSDLPDPSPDDIDRAYQLATSLRQSNLPQYRDTYGWTRHLKGETDEALAIIQEAVAALPANPWLHYHLGMVYTALKRYAKARTELQTALTLAGKDPFPVGDTIRRTLAGMSSL